MRPALLPLFIVAFSRLILRNGDGKSKTLRVLWLLASLTIPALWLWWLGKSTAIGTIVGWRVLTLIFSQWPAILPQRHTTKEKVNSFNSVKRTGAFLAQGGPLGRGCSKAIELLVAGLLWYCLRGSLPESVATTFNLTENVRIALSLPLPRVVAVTVGICVLSAAANGVLHLWSQYARSSGNHTGLHMLLRPTLQRDLSAREHCELAFLAILNATCEECSSRGFWRRELEHTAGLSAQSSNICQAIMFGAWHYFGVPSGWTGVALTSVYGWIMGTAADYSKELGLTIPILMHSIADYYIFAVLARRKQSPQPCT
jgi:membrane protease YdiL (CAAX protease family)